jgi:septum site-determining protein MinC
VVVVGDVNPGAEIVAGGDIIVWGKLRGTVHAGAMGDDSAVVCALQLQPMQLRISGNVARSPEANKTKQRVRPEMARVRGTEIVAEPWEP